MPSKTELTEFKEMCQDLSILMVEDDVVLANSYRDMAVKFFKSVMVSNDPFEAIKLHQPGRFDIIYTDINMPGMTGVEMIREIKNFDREQKFIVISASDEFANLLNLLKLNISAFILKPFHIDNFMKVTIEQVSIILHARMMAQKASELQEQLKEVTQEKEEQENLLIQQSKLAQTGEMISMIAHQWRQPLSCITTPVAALKTRLDLGTYDSEKDPFSALSADLYKAFEKIEKSAEYLSQTINDFRNYYRQDNAVASFNICDSIETVLGMSIMDDSPIEVHMECCSKSDAVIETYKGELQQVLMSIINNAKDVFSEQKIKEPKLSITVKKTGNDLHVHVCDNAGGIDEEIMEHIFMPYFSTKSEKNGTGIGLHMAKTIIERHMAGTLSAVNSATDGGACFIIKIPVNNSKG